MHYAVIINYHFGKKIFFPIKRKLGLNNRFKSLILSVFSVASRLKPEQKKKKKGKINLETKYNMI